MFENVDGRTDDRRTDAGVTGILIAHLGAFGSGELKRGKVVHLFVWFDALCPSQEFFSHVKTIACLPG